METGKYYDDDVKCGNKSQFFLFSFVSYRYSHELCFKSELEIKIDIHLMDNQNQN